MQINHSNYRSKFYSNNLNSTFTNLLGNNVETIIRTGTKLDFFAFTQNSNRKENYLKKCNTNLKKLSFRKEIDFLYSFKNILNSNKSSSTYQDFDFLELIYINENQHLLKEQRSPRREINIKTHRNGILPLFDLLINHVNRLQLSDLNFQHIKNLNTLKQDHSSPGIEIKNIDKYIIHDINNFFGFKKGVQLFSNHENNKISIILLKFLNEYYKICSKSLIELAIQVIRIMNINILRSKYISINHLSEIIIIVLSVINICLDIFFYIFNWKSIPKIGMAIEMIHLILTTLYFYGSEGLTKEFFNIYAQLLYYSYIYRIIFILQCKFTNKYNKFQVTEIIRTQLKQIFYSIGNDISSMISSSEFENICAKLGIDIFDQSSLVSQSLYTYLFQNFDWVQNKFFGLEYNIPTLSLKERKLKKNSNNNQRFVLIYNQFYSHFKLVYLKLCLFCKSQILAILKSFFISLKFNYCRLQRLFSKEFNGFICFYRKTGISSYQEYISNKKKLTYEDFEMLLVSLDCKKKLLNRIDCHTNLFDITNGSCLLLHRKIIFEQLFYNITLFIFATVTVISTIETIINSYGNKYSQANCTASIIQKYFYFLIIFLSSIFHLKVDKMYFSSSLKSYNRIINKYDLIYGNLKLAEKNLSFSNKDNSQINLSMNDYLSEFLSNHCAESLKKYVDSLSKYLPQGVAASLLRKFDFSTLSPQYKEITILFSDIVGFTGIAERVDPLLLFCLLTNYFDEMVKIIEEFHGNLLEIAGDAILVIWNSPMAVKNHSAAAVAASLKMKKQLKLKSRSFGNNYIPEINIKCGIHTDHVLIGNIGCSKRMKYGIMGDGVNLASRIESLTRRYSADIIISNNVFVNKEVQKRFVICPLDVVVVQGKSNPTVIYHVLNTVNDSDPISLLKSKFHTKALIFFINKDFKRSLFYIEKINKLEPFKNDLSTISLSNKCKQFQDTKLDFNWSCAEVLKKKYFNE
ncbi:unnamed protein product [Cryptosporidium hominis]|uniref:Adenylyl cyclase class-3/4/guanylyl cyclase n=2 Tax=Cryptosporidium hominis TaxID=237895 RepID=A0A0S4TF62_CRYHO|nr:Adenylate and Guanylate cyclase catalytic domain [Cryptosporidium hominis]PPA63814.1 Adenylate and Guanylate cyclase catalytic domain protein [Cryptosporidium hominis]PPS93443.1 Adenylyl cyclase class-3/4/guanylyl cyclase [Cryptosporidium hominis]CUV06118.1 unnamed protein product [Cryptosporidium hominis]|eukprot:PPS93443.1 Adenylyl cyclase class-3/4/guanylyl cyclase [Cryptosporidium hominis]